MTGSAFHSRFCRGNPVKPTASPASAPMRRQHVNAADSSRAMRHRAGYFEAVKIAHLGAAAQSRGRPIPSLTLRQAAPARQTATVPSLGPKRRRCTRGSAHA